MTKAVPSSQFPNVANDAARTSKSSLDPDRAAFQEIFASQFHYVWNALRRLGIPERDLEDVTHDIFLQVYRQWRHFDAARPIRPWLFGFAFRIASDYRRRARHRLEVLEPGAESVDPAPNADEHLARAELLSAGYQALDTLEIGRRAVFILYELDGCAMKDIAAALEIPVNTAYSRLRLAREQFHATLARWRLGRGAL